MRFLPERVRCEMTAVSLQSKPAILTAGKGVGGRANANCERGDLAYGRQCRFQAACRRLDHLLGHSVLLTLVGYRVWVVKRDGARTLLISLSAPQLPGSTRKNSERD